MKQKLPQPDMTRLIISVSSYFEASEKLKAKKNVCFQTDGAEQDTTTERDIPLPRKYTISQSSTLLKEEAFKK